MQVSLLGCGWLGLPLAKALLSKGYTVKGSTTTPGKVTVLREAGIDPFIIDLEDKAPAQVPGFLRESDLLIINIPPGVKTGNSLSYAGKLAKLYPFVQEAGIKKLLFVSSTSVYADDNSRVTEVTVPNPGTESGRQVLEAEQLLRANDNFKTTIVRFAGLTGPGRHPVKHLAGRENIANPNAPVNLIHQDDCTGIILALIEKDIWGDTFNAAAPQHPTREAYYTQKAIAAGLPLPRFNHEAPSVGKTIISDKIAEALGYVFIKEQP